MNLYSVFKFDFISVLLMVIYLTSTIFFYFYLLKKEKLLTQNTVFIAIISFATPLIFFVLDQTFLIKSIPPDTRIYSDLILDFKKHFNTYSFGVTGYSVLNYIPFKLCFRRPAVFVVFNIIYYQVAVLYLYKAFKIYCVNHNKNLNSSVFVILQVLTILYPVGIIHNASLLRESMMLMFFSINLYFMAKFYFEDFSKHIVIMLFMAFLFIIRPLTGICLLSVYMLAYLHKRSLLTLKNLLKLGLILFLLSFVGKKVVLSLYDLDFNIEWIANYRKKSNSFFGIEGYKTLDWDSQIYYLKNLFLIVCQYIFSPLPILVSKEVTFNKLIPLVDSIYIIVVVLMPIVFFWKKSFNKWILVFFTCIIFPAVLETNISGAYRHRMNAIFMLLPVAAYIYTLIKLKKPISING